MGLLPEENSIRIDENGINNIYPSSTYQMHVEEESINGIITEETKAIEQAVYKILNTERYKYIIYSSNYGVELEELFGKPMPFILPEIPRRIKEALIQDDRIRDVDNFILNNDKQGNVTVEFTVHTVYGDIKAKKEVKV